MHSRISIEEPSVTPLYFGVDAESNNIERLDWDGDFFCRHICFVGHVEVYVQFGNLRFSIETSAPRVRQP